MPSLASVMPADSRAARSTAPAATPGRKRRLAEQLTWCLADLSRLAVDATLSLRYLGWCRWLFEFLQRFPASLAPGHANLDDLRTAHAVDGVDDPTCVIGRAVEGFPHVGESLLHVNAGVDFLDGCLGFS
jgi:hypothetical protein